MFGHYRSDNIGTDNVYYHYLPYKNFAHQDVLFVIVYRCLLS